MIDLQRAHRDIDTSLRALALERGWALAPWWPGVRLEGQHPTSPDQVMRRAEAIGRHHEQLLASEERRERGTHLTPGAIALTLARELFERSGAVDSVLDPCCGAGIFLIAARVAQSEPVTLYGSDLNATALAWCWGSFALAFPDKKTPPQLELKLGDGLLIELPRCDAVLTNPPFRTSMRGVSEEERPRFSLYRERWLLGARGRSDLSMAFVEACARCVSPSGWFAAVLPEAQLASHSGRPLRQFLAQSGTPHQLRHLGSDAFADAVVRTCTLIWSSRHDARANFQAVADDESVSQPVAELLSGDWAKHFVNPHHPPNLHAKYPTQPLGDVADIRRLFTDDFYFVGRSIVEGQSDSQPAVITVAHVEPGHHLWGERKVRIGGKRWERPILDQAALAREDSDRAARLAQRWKRHRIALATRGAVIECCQLNAGEVAQVPLIELWSNESPETTALVYAQLLSPAATAWYLQNHAAMDQTGAGIDLRAVALKALPIIAPEHWPAPIKAQTLKLVDQLGQKFHPDVLLKLQRTVMALFTEKSEPAIGWWWSRVPKRMPKPTFYADL
jgi:SAM-dependent methyltransferase